MHKSGHYARIPAAMCPGIPVCGGYEGMNAEHNETVGQASADIKPAPERWVRVRSFNRHDVQFTRVHETRP